MDSDSGDSSIVDDPSYDASVSPRCLEVKHLKIAVEKDVYKIEIKRKLQGMI